ncbi:molybdenum cofactor synthesis 2 [Rhinolophus ferrumequinum]|uniref:Molybdenum cofactor synthesis 2 n=1 Tax=Rhinolophus ferrumequinum TaxID=59479 RepID=A0A7J7Y5L0_RHIFE|nr:molybdenum cofactor synthesis 2 [Rhinolophus ferrumequinum]
MSSLEISSSCFNQETKLPLSPPLVEGSAFEPLEKDVNEVEEKPKDIIKFTAEKLSVDEVSQLVTSPLCGAISLFVGTTRNNFEGKKVISLEYEALVPVSEASIIIAVSSAHRAASLEAVSYAIDTLKAKVPIWKKEMYEESSSSWKRNKECFWATSD